MWNVVDYTECERIGRGNQPILCKVTVLFSYVKTLSVFETCLRRDNIRNLSDAHLYRFCLFFVAGLFEKGKHVALVVLDAGLVKRIDIEHIA